MFTSSIAYNCICCCRRLKIGAATLKVTPGIETPMAGYYSKGGVEKIHDDLYAEALINEKDVVKIAIVECDVVGRGRFYRKPAGSYC